MRSERAGPAGRLTDVPGLRVGCWTDSAGLTGCTVVLCPQPGAVFAADVRGGAPGTRETELGRPGMLVERANAVLLTGGSAYGLDAAAGVMRWLEEHGAGYTLGRSVVPIVPAAVVFDLAPGASHARPGPEQGYLACEQAGLDVPEGNAGAGTGCTVGKLLGPGRAMRGGQGTAARRVAGGWVVGALAVVNAVGNIVDPASGRIVAGARGADGGAFADLDRWLAGEAAPEAPPALNTTIGVVATDAPLDKSQVQRVAWMAHDGLARAIYPSHTLFDGDTVFALSTAAPGAGGAARDPPAVSLLGAAAAQMLASAIVRAVRAAASLPSLPAARDWHAPGSQQAQ